MLAAELLDAIEARAAAMPLRTLADATAALTQRYRRDPAHPHADLSPEVLRIAYLVTRMPATAAAITRAMHRVGECMEPAPRTLLDLGAGPATAAFAARHAFPTINAVTLLEPVAEWQADARSLAEAIGDTTIAAARWITARLPAPVEGTFDMVTMAYALGELPPADRHLAVDQAWGATAGVLLLVEAGTPDGSARLLEARARLLAAGAHLVAPCPHRASCPLALAGEWCHESVRLPRRRLHRAAKGGDLGFEDEKFAYLAVARMSARRPAARMVEPPVIGKGHLSRRLCGNDGTLRCETVLRRDRAAWTAAARSQWGDPVPPWTDPQR